MSNRCTIYIAIIPEKVEEFKELLQSLGVDYIVQQEHDSTRFLGEELKWFTSYDEVRDITDFIDKYGKSIAVYDDGTSDECGSNHRIDMYIVSTIKGF